jgi:hypothetical protein
MNLASFIEKFSLGCTEENNFLRAKALAKLKAALLEVFISETEFRYYEFAVLFQYPTRR